LHVRASKDRRCSVAIELVKRQSCALEREPGIVGDSLQGAKIATRVVEVKADDQQLQALGEVDLRPRRPRRNDPERPEEHRRGPRCEPS
jgi:hypothetical protein